MIALNFPPKTGNAVLDTVHGCNIYSTFCADPEREDIVYMSSDSYEEIFGKTRAKSSTRMKRLSVVRIWNFESNQTIYRQYRYNPGFTGVTNEMIVLHPASIRELAKEKNDEVANHEMAISKGCRFLYYWKHPFHATRISMKLGVFSILLSVVAILLALIA